MKTLVIDYGSGNLRSCAKALEAAGFNVRISANPKDAMQADALVLPGQGHFGQVMQSFLQSGFEDVLRQHIAAQKPFLGICVGMQILFEQSQEAPGVAGLGLLPGQIQKFSANSKLSVPQMQWNKLQAFGQSPLMRGLSEDAYVYFVHSYFSPVSKNILHGAVSNYGQDFLALLSQQNIHATQFHPEKSQAVGLSILKNFKYWAENF